MCEADRNTGKGKGVNMAIREVREVKTRFVSSPGQAWRYVHH